MFLPLVGGFVLSASVVMAAVWHGGRWLRSEIPADGVIAAALALCALADVAFPRVRCSLFRRQTSEYWVVDLPRPIGGFLWGLDTGTIVSTFRASAASWAALLLVAAGWAPAWSGLVYAAAFCIPLSAFVARGGQSICRIRPAMSYPQRRVEGLAQGASYLRVTSALLASTAGISMVLHLA